MTEAFITIKMIFTMGLVICATILTYLGLNAESFTLFAILLLIDYVTGVGKAKVLGYTITSNKMKYGIASKMVLLLIPIVLGIATKSLGQSADNILFIGINILVLSEVYSIIGNIYSIRTMEELPEIDAVAALGKMIKTKLLLLSGDKNNE